MATVDREKRLRLAQEHVHRHVDRRLVAFVDQAQLHGLLARIRDLGLELQCVGFLPDPEKPSARPRPRKEGG